MRETLLIIGGGFEALEGIKTAQRLGLRLIIVDGNVNAPGFKLSDYKIVVSTYDFLKILQEIKKLEKNGVRIDGVISMCADVPLCVAIIAKKLSLPGLSIQTARLVSDKLAMKDELKAKGIPIPKYADVSDKKNLHRSAQNIGFPIVVKPVDSRGSRGVQIIDFEKDLETAWVIARSNSPTHRVMIEEFLQGPQISTETICNDGAYATIGFADRNYEWLPETKPYIIENGGDAPTQLGTYAKEEITNVVEKAALSLGITTGIAKGDMVYTDKGAKVIEIAGRLSGGYFSTIQIPLATGIDFVEKAIKIALGKTLNPSELIPQKKQAVAIRYIKLDPGIFISVKGLQKARSSTGVKMLQFFIKKNEKILKLSDHTKRSGFVITVGKTKAEAITRAEKALSKLSFQILDFKL